MSITLNLEMMVKAKKVWVRVSVPCLDVCCIHLVPPAPWLKLILQALSPFVVLLYGLIESLLGQSEILGCLSLSCDLPAML